MQIAFALNHSRQCTLYNVPGSFFFFYSWFGCCVCACVWFRLLLKVMFSAFSFAIYAVRRPYALASIRFDSIRFKIWFGIHCYRSIWQWSVSSSFFSLSLSLSHTLENVLFFNISDTHIMMICGLNKWIHMYVCCVCAHAQMILRPAIIHTYVDMLWVPISLLEGNKRLLLHERAKINWREYQVGRKIGRHAEKA